MTHKAVDQRTCALCGKTFAARNVVLGEAIREQVADEIRKEFPNWSTDSFVCKTDLSRFRGRYVDGLLASEKGELTSLEKEVLESLQEHELVSENVEAEFEHEQTLGEKLADYIATFGGSWTFLICFGVFLAFWIGANSIALFTRPPDPYPFILLNLLLSCLAAVQAPVILMSQNRQEKKDRLRSQHDYQVNLKAELEIRHLHQKVDHLLFQQWERLAQIQEVQLELLHEVSHREL